MPPPPPTPTTHASANRAPAAWAIIILFLAAVFAVATGLLGVGRGADGGGQKDFAWMWAAGQCWRAGANPYDYERVLKPVLAPLVGAPNAFAYAPQSAPLCIAIAFLPLSMAKLMMTVANALGVVAVALFVWTTLRRPPRGLTRAPPVSPTSAALLVALVIGAPMTSHTLAMGQSSLLVAAGLVWGWLAAYSNRPVLAGVMLAIASIKPPFVALPVVWLVLDRQWRPLLWFTIACGALALYPLLMTGPITVLTTWFDSIRQYKTAFPNRIGFEHNMGLPNLLYAMGLHGVIDLTLVACAGAFALYFYRPRLDNITVLGILAVLYLSFGVSHDYDLLMLVPTLVAMTFLVRGHRFESLTALAVAALLMMPQRVLRPLHMPALLHWRTAVLLVLLGWMLWLALRRRGTGLGMRPLREAQANALS